MRIPFAKPSIGRAEYRAVKKVLASGWITTGSETAAFEREFAALINGDGARSAGAPTNILADNTNLLRAKAVQSATAGLHLSFLALGLRKNDVVFTTPLTFSATAAAALHAGARVVFVDCKKNSRSMDEDAFAAAVKKEKHARAFLPVHIAGCAWDNLAELNAIARKKSLFIVEDAAHAFPARETDGAGRKQFLGTSGDIGVYSFYANKTITTAEGGMVVCRDAALHAKISTLHNHGIDRSVWDRFKNAPLQYEYDIVEAGWKYNLPDLLSALGRVQLARAFELQEKRAACARRYLKNLAGVDYIELPSAPREGRAHSWHLFMVRIMHPRLSRDDFIRKLAALGIGTSVHYKPLHLMTYYQKALGLTARMFPNARAVYEQSLSLPLYPDMRAREVDEVCRAIIKIGSLSA